MGFKRREPRRAYKVGDVVVLQVETGHWSKGEFVITGQRPVYQPIIEIRKRGDAPHRGSANERFSLDGATCDEIEPRPSWRSSREFKLAIPAP